MFGTPVLTQDASPPLQHLSPSYYRTNNYRSYYYRNVILSNALIIEVQKNSLIIEMHVKLFISENRGAQWNPLLGEIFNKMNLILALN